MPTKKPDARGKRARTSPHQSLTFTITNADTISRSEREELLDRFVRRLAAIAIELHRNKAREAVHAQEAEEGEKP